jgi:hypothetical protein
MTLPRTVADVLSDHVVLEVECIDRLYLNVYQPRLQYPTGAAGFFIGHRGARFAGGSNGYRLRVWKVELARPAAETGLDITVCISPPARGSGTSR